MPPVLMMCCEDVMCSRHVMPPVLTMCCVAVDVFQTCHASCSDDVLCGCWCVMPPVLMMCGR